MRRRVAHCPPWMLRPTLRGALSTTRLSIRGSTPPQEEADRARHLHALVQVDAQETPGKWAQTDKCWDAVV